MLIITDTETGKKYKVLRFDNIKKGDPFLTDDMYIICALADCPETMGSFILEEMDTITCHKCGKRVHVYDSFIDHAGDNSLYCSKACRGY